MSKYIEVVTVEFKIASVKDTFSMSTLKLAGCI